MSGTEKDIGEAEKSSRSVVRSVKAEDPDWSMGEERPGKKVDEALDVVGLGEGRTWAGEGRESPLEMAASKANQLLNDGNGWVAFIVAVAVEEEEEVAVLLSLMLD